MPFIADFHIHSKYSRATAKDMDVPSLARWAKIKGASMLGSGDFTHPLWLSELKKHLKEAGDGIYIHDGIYFILTAEVSNIYFKAGRTRKVHNIIFVPSMDAAEETGRLLGEYGAVASDGRPILSLECDKMVRLVTGIDPRIFIVPAHAWTPHFSVFGSNSGFDSPEECFEDQAPKIFSIETGLSSDPKMNWRWSALDRFCLMSNSDAHSPSKICREANVFKGKIDYAELADILKKKDRERFLYTIEFYPEEGKYHWDGHRACKTRLSPKEAMRLNNICPVCGKRVTVGVEHRLEDMADRSGDYEDSTSPPFKSLIPLAEVISDCLGVGPASMTAEREYMQLIKYFGNEMNILIDVPEADLKSKCPASIAKGIINMRKGDLDIMPGYDGEFGKISVFKDGGERSEKQLSFF